MDNEHGACITIGGEEYELILTTKATKEMVKRYKNLDNVRKKLSDLDEIVWLLVLLANQSILIHNMKNPAAPRTLLTEETLDLLTSPVELLSFSGAIEEAVTKGAVRKIESEPEKGDGKNS